MEKGGKRKEKGSGMRDRGREREREEEVLGLDLSIDLTFRRAACFFLANWYAFLLITLSFSS